MADNIHSTLFHSTTFEIITGSHEVALDITDRCATFLDERAAGRDGLLNVFVPHATAGIAVLETGSGSDDDLLATLRELLPADDRWRHRHGSPGHGRDHVIPGLVAPHATLPVIGGQLALGVWQSVVLVDTNGDNLRRTVRLSFLG
ncbi:YjbQ family protein [Kitasatospora sp. CM 4170]|uniref:YjbQ family protein n=1 Tax=Kitasatospora aburaviensis TaxID=67265 RepID=A0ABW1EP88_9ACTN|nr:YjbQ family protein [Kitasatospora sp. CM 4170]WNM48596.1 YjbQ family protein [Kitasatospora sp. CM 4170]